MNNFACDFCDMKFFTNKALQIHLKSVQKDDHNEEKFICNICEFRFCKSAGLSKHRKTNDHY